MKSVSVLQYYTFGEEDLGPSITGHRVHIFRMFLNMLKLSDKHLRLSRHPHVLCVDTQSPCNLSEWLCQDGSSSQSLTWELFSIRVQRSGIGMPRKKCGPSSTRTLWKCWKLRDSDSCKDDFTKGNFICDIPNVQSYSVIK